MVTAAVAARPNRPCKGVNKCEQSRVNAAVQKSTAALSTAPAGTALLLLCSPSSLHAKLLC